MTYEHQLAWLRADAPYTPFVQLGILACLRGIDDGATVRWQPDASGFVLRCVLQTDVDLDQLAAAIVNAPWPDLAALDWPTGFGQAIKPALAKAPHGAGSAWRALSGVPRSALARPTDGVEAASRHVAALLTDGVVDGDGGLGRSRLLRGVKADLSGVKAPRLDAVELASELCGGPIWRTSGAGSGLGLVPEVQTFGGVTGPKPDSVNASSRLLFALIVHGLGVLPPFGVLAPTRRIVGGPLVAPGALVWPVQTTPRGLRALLGLYGSVRTSEGVSASARGVAVIYRSEPRAINSMISMFPFGELVT